MQSVWASDLRSEINQGSAPASSLSSPTVTPQELVSQVERLRRKFGPGGHVLIRERFFAEPGKEQERIALGLAETPNEVVDLMITITEDLLTHTTEGIDAKDARWLDPCSGTGAFPVGLVRRAIARSSLDESALALEDLPRIDCWDILEEGLLGTLLGIQDALEGTHVSLLDYLASGRLGVRAGDFLAGYPDTPELGLPVVEGGYDVVIGNPPYVRARQLDSARREELRRQFPNLYRGAADLYSYFFAAGFNALSPTGVLTYVTPASFSRAANGSALRRRLLSSGAVITYVDLDEAPLFQGVNVHAAITSLRLGSEQGLVRFAHRTGRTAGPIELNWSSTRLDMNINGGFTFRKRPSLPAAKREHLRTLDSEGIRIRSGVRPGSTKAFVVGPEGIVSLDPAVRDSWIKPILLGADIQTWSTDKVNHYLIWTPKGCATPPAQLLALLEPHRDDLERRPERRHLAEWYMLRACRYYEEMLRPGICYPDIARRPRFSRSQGGVLVADGAYFIDSDHPVLLAILNSSQAKRHFDDTCSSLGSLSGRGRYRLKMQAVKSLAIPSNWSDDGVLQSNIDSLVRRQVEEPSDLGDEIQEAVDKLYGDYS